VDGAIIFDTGRGMGRKKEENKRHKTKPGNRMHSQGECPTKIDVELIYATVLIGHSEI
jgi:hypothetical protein